MIAIPRAALSFRLSAHLPDPMPAEGDPWLLVTGKRAAIVGSRDADAHALRLAHRIAHGLASRGWCIVSGLARGVDTAAHRAALEAHGPTIGVLGTTLTESYPPENAELQAAIGSDHLLLSGFDGMLERNRGIVAISDMVIVPACQPRSGTWATVNFALSQGVPVYSGIPWLLKQGARPLMEIPHDYL